MNLTMTRPLLPDPLPALGASEPVPASSYSQWVRKVIRSVQSERNLLVSLFDSSVPEPLQLLQQIMLKAWSDPVTSRYTSAFSGNPYVITQLAQRYSVPEANVLSATGATGALSLIYRALLRPGDRVLVETPGFDLFDTIARASGLEVDTFHRRGNGFAVDPDEIAARLTPATRLIVLSNLHNPSGMVLEPATLASIGRIAEARGIHVVVDEVYADYVEEAQRQPAAATLSPAFISINSLTKSYGLSTLRCGWIVAADAPMRHIRALAEETEFGVSNLAHAAAALVLEQPEPFTEFRKEIMRKARPIIESYHAHWREAGLVTGELPAYGCIALPRLNGIDDTIGFSEWLADRCGVIVAPGEYFGASGHIRIGFARAPADVDYGLQALTDGLIRYRDLHARKGQS